MNSRFFKIYQSSPYPLRRLAAGLWGSRLGRWRYGSKTDRLVNEALQRENWDSVQWQNWREERLNYILSRAAARVPFYRQHWAQLRRNTASNPPRLADWPILRKQSLRADPRAFLAEDCDVSRMWSEHTSGSTGTPVTLWQSRETLQAWYALFEARWRRWYGLSRHNRWAIIGGQLVAAIEQKHPPFWVWNSGLNQLYLSSYHLAPQHTLAYVKALADHRVIYLWGYASAMTTLARNILDQGLKPPPLKAAISNAEPLYSHQREIIGRAFAGRVHDTYGMSEMACAASECEHGTMHLWPEVGIWEVLGDNSDEPVPPGEPGRLLCTGLLNGDMPLIRYEVGDRVCLSEPEATCACGRALPILRSVEGRNDDVILTRDGRRVGRLDPVFKKDLPIREAQIIQESLDVIRVLVVAAPGLTRTHEHKLVASLCDHLGNFEVVIERVPEIPRAANGKFRAVVSKVTNEAVQAARANYI